VKYIEVEQKFRLLSSPDELKATLTDRGAKRGDPSHQIDTYFNAPHRDFLGGEVISEWLRVRVEDASASLNFKRWYPLEEKTKTHCDEFESTVTDAEAVRRTLAALDFTELTVVDKHREEWTTDSIAVAFDTVAGLGNFIEFEFKGETDTIEDATARIEEFISSLNVELGERINTGYPHMTLGITPDA
jgi:adenylate cyclase, class 2